MATSAFDKEAINQITPSELEAHGLIKKSDRGEKTENHGYECVYCTSGTGRKRSGALNFDERNGIWQHFCQACGNGGDNIKFFQHVFNADFADACRQASEMFNIPFSGESNSTSRQRRRIAPPPYLSSDGRVNLRKKFRRYDLPQNETKADELPLIQKDITDGKHNLNRLPESQRRGLENMTLEYFNCGYLREWIHPALKVKGEGYPSRRIIIPTSDNSHYLACMLDADRTPDTTHAKMHAGAKRQVFNVADLEQPIVIVVEGAIDAMSMFQALFASSSFAGFSLKERDVGIVATLSAQGWKSLIASQIDAGYLGYRKYIILLDADETGESQGAEFRHALSNRRCPSVIKFLKNYLTDDERKRCPGKVDANDILKTFGNHTLRRILNQIITESKNFFKDFEPTQLDLDFNKPTPPETPKASDIPAEFHLTDEQRAFLFSGDQSDLDNARRAEYLFGDKMRFVTDNNQWMTFKNGLWRFSEEGDSAISPTFTNLADIMLANAADKHEFTLARRLKTSKVVSAAIKSMRSLISVRITSDDLNQHNNLLNCLNGVVDLETGKFYPDVDPLLLITQRTGAIYRPNYRDPVIDKFLRDILPDDETRNVLLRFLGYGLTGEVCEEKSIFFHGDGGNGKGSLTKTLTRTAGDYASVIKASALIFNSKSNDAGAASPELNPLENCRLAFAEEFPQGQRLDTAKFKNLSGGDLIPIRKLHHEQIQIEPHFSLILSGNYLPELSDTRDPGLLRRILVIYFTESFTGSRADPHLKAKLSTPNALAGLLSLLVDEAQFWYRDGLLLPSSAMRRATNDYFAQNDFIGEFIEEYCTRGQKLSIPRKQFLARLKNEYTSECMKQFGNRDRALTDAITRIDGIDYRRVKGERRFYGIGWRDSSDQYQDDLNYDPAPVDEPIPEFDLSQFDED